MTPERRIEVKGRLGDVVSPQGTILAVLADLRTARFSVREANFLAAAQVAELARRVGVRALLVKGFSLEYHGLRKGYPFSDTDVLVDPDRAEVMSNQLEAAGWVERPVSFLGSVMTKHSRSYIQDCWPNDIDLHVEYPGLLVDSRLAFETLWSRRVEIRLAGQPCWIPDRHASMVMWGLHSLRGMSREHRYQRELELLAAELESASRDGHLVELMELVVELRADPMFPLLAEAGSVIPTLPPPDPAALAEWKRKVTQATEVTPWLQVFRETPRRQRPALLWRALWLPAADLREAFPPTRDTPLARFGARIGRIKRLSSLWLNRHRHHDRSL